MRNVTKRSTLSLTAVAFAAILIPSTSLCAQSLPNKNGDDGLYPMSDRLDLLSSTQAGDEDVKPDTPIFYQPNFEEAEAHLKASKFTILELNQSELDQADVDTIASDKNVRSLAPAKKPKSNPISKRILFSQYLTSVVSGDADSTLRYGGKADLYLDIKGSAIGLDDSIKFHLHPEFRYGQSSNGTVGLLPSNTALFYPDDNGETFDLSINVTKSWKNGTSLTVGKVNILDLAAKLPVSGGGGHEGFQNLAMALPPSAIVPGSITGALLNVPTKKALFRFWVFDPQSSSDRSGLSNPFDKGVAFLGSVTIPTKIGGQRGYYALKLAGSTRSEIASESLPAALIPPVTSDFGKKKGEFSAVLAAYQFLDTYEGMPGKGWGIFGQIYASAGDPTFLDASGFIGVSGNPKFRPDDRFGIAWFRYSLTDSFVDALQFRIPLEDEEGLEAFYTVSLNKNFNLTADVQIVDSAVSSRDVGVTGTLGLTLKL